MLFILFASKTFQDLSFVIDNRHVITCLLSMALSGDRISQLTHTDECGSPIALIELMRQRQHGL